MPVRKKGKIVHFSYTLEYTPHALYLTLFLSLSLSLCFSFFSFSVSFTQYCGGSCKLHDFMQYFFTLSSRDRTFCCIESVVFASTKLMKTISTICLDATALLNCLRTSDLCSCIKSRSAFVALGLIL